jgi:hypothetical protein
MDSPSPPQFGVIQEFAITELSRLKSLLANPATTPSESTPGSDFDTADDIKESADLDSEHKVSGDVDKDGVYWEKKTIKGDVQMARVKKCEQCDAVISLGECVRGHS